ncbi:4-alpha-glucanotransferase [bacterium]|nr:4-alpha-glucanotransferase [bacterium]MCI0604429.1 4-alpha-glucanotransferase [bacterium]
MLQDRGNGVLLHLSSLPSAHGIGDLGSQAYRFVDFLAQSGQQYWQILPLNPTGTYLGNSPYTSYSVFAGNALFISVESLYQLDLLSKTDLESAPTFPQERVNYAAVVDWKGKILRRAFHHAEERLRKDRDFSDFCRKNADWLEDFSLFAALKDHYKEIAWYEWPEPVRDRESAELSVLRNKLEKRTLRSKFIQYVFFKQWQSLREYANKKKIKIIGDIPIYPSLDSADAWSHPELFKLDENKKPLYVAGAPPDYFSETGQRWGNPVYRWDELQRTGYAWWIRRLRQNLQFCDLLRLDHFRGLVAYWEIPAEEETAVKGKWVQVPVKDFFETVKKEIPSLPLILEDLGLITPDVKEVMQELGYPGMKVLLFAFGPDLPTNPYAPHNYIRNCVVYTGTHDNNTIRGWFENEAGAEERERLQQYLGHSVNAQTVSDSLNRLAMSSVARICILPFQDILGLGEEARMNLPSQSSGNWEWRVQTHQLTEDVVRQLLDKTRLYGRY